MPLMSGVMHGGKLHTLEEAEKLGLKMPDPIPIKAEDIAASREANAQLEVLAKRLTEDERKALIHASIHARHRYHGHDKDGRQHICDGPPGLTHLIHITHRDGRLVHHFTDDAELAQTAAKNATMSKDEHMKIVESFQHIAVYGSPATAQEAKDKIAYHLKEAEEAEGKTAEVVPLQRLLEG